MIHLALSRQSDPDSRASNGFGNIGYHSRGRTGSAVTRAMRWRQTNPIDPEGLLGHVTLAQKFSDQRRRQGPSLLGKQELRWIETWP
jgi:hypothetical protein